MDLSSVSTRNSEPTDGAHNWIEKVVIVLREIIYSTGWSHSNEYLAHECFIPHAHGLIVAPEGSDYSLVNNIRSKHTINVINMSTINRPGQRTEYTEVTFTTRLKRAILQC